MTLGITLYNGALYNKNKYKTSPTWVDKKTSTFGGQKPTPGRWNEQTGVGYSYYKSENYNVQAKSKGFQPELGSQAQEPCRGPTF